MFPIPDLLYCLISKGDHAHAVQLEIEKIRAEAKETEQHLQAEIKTTERRLQADIRACKNTLRLEIEQVRGEIRRSIWQTILGLGSLIMVILTLFRFVH